MGRLLTKHNLAQIRLLLWGSDSFAHDPPRVISSEPQNKSHSLNNIATTPRGYVGTMLLMFGWHTDWHSLSPYLGLALYLFTSISVLPLFASLHLTPSHPVCLSPCLSLAPFLPPSPSILVSVSLLF